MATNSQPETSKHTPGPWSYSDTHGYGDWEGEKEYGVEVIENVVFKSSTGITVLLACDCCNGITCSRANARLIAAAPELLRACITAMDWLADKGVPHDHVEVKRILAAIAKAEERTR